MSTAPVVLVPLRVDDAAELAVLLADPRLHEFIGGAPATEAELRRRYTVQVQGHSPDGRERWLNWVVRLGPSGPAVGYTQATVDRTDGTAELAWVIGVPWQGRGLAVAAVRSMSDELRALGVTRRVAHIHPDHHASAAVATRVGLHRTGRVSDGEDEWSDDEAAPSAVVRWTACRPGRTS